MPIQADQDPARLRHPARGPKQTSSMGAEVGDGFPPRQVQYIQDIKIKIKKSNYD